MNAIVKSVRSLWVPLEGANLLMPNVAVAEVIGYQPYELVETNTEWLLGSLRWRGLILPVVSMEAMCGYDLPDSSRNARIAIVNSTQYRSKLDFYAIVTAGIPRLINADNDALGEAVDVDELPDTVASQVQIGSERAMIPDLQQVQLKIEEAWAEIV
jgi:chemosensory pili system protein ChpC